MYNIKHYWVYQKLNIENNKPIKYSEIKMNDWVYKLEWRKFNVRLIRLLRAGLENDVLIFSKFAKMLIQEKLIIVFIDKCLFKFSSLTLYIWMKKDEPSIKIIRNTSKRFNSIAVKLDDKVYFMIKNDTSEEDDAWLLINLLMK